MQHCKNIQLNKTSSVSEVTTLTCCCWPIVEVCRHVLRHLLCLTHVSAKINKTITDRQKILGRGKINGGGSSITSTAGWNSFPFLSTCGILLVQTLVEILYDCAWCCMFSLFFFLPILYAKVDHNRDTELTLKFEYPFHTGE